ncbi:MAG: hypothetical protein V1668_04700 [Patescibacteria group bacterium]
MIKKNTMAMLDNGNKKILSFSEDFLKAEYHENAKSLEIDAETIILNLGSKNLEFEREKLRPYHSSVYSGVKIEQAESVVLINCRTESFSEKYFIFSDRIINTWPSAYDIFKIPGLKETKLWRSRKDRRGNIGLNLWFAKAGTNCGIHNEHGFRELHTQIFGIGRMQKFHENDFRSKYQDVYMSPGYTHEPFYFSNLKYPWHQYYADTDCMWLATEVY